MRRWLIRIFVVLLLGAIVNVAVAWIPVWRASWPLLRFTTDESIQDWPSAVPPHWPQFQQARRADSAAWTLTRYLGVRSVSACLIDVTEAGWPLRSMCAESWQEAGAITRVPASPAETTVAHQRRWERGIRLKSGLSLPLKPMWTGFAGNTALYAAALLVMFVALVALRRHLCIRRRLCAQCAYPIGTNPCCTECGAAVARKAAMT